MKNDYYRNEHLIKVKYPHEAYGRKMKRKEKLLYNTQKKGEKTEDGMYRNLFVLN